MKRRRFNQIGNKVQRWNDENCGPLDSNLYGLLAFNTEKGQKLLSPRGNLKNRIRLRKAARAIKVSVEELEQWFEIFERREHRKEELRLEEAVANGDISSAQARAMREA